MDLFILLGQLIKISFQHLMKPFSSIILIRAETILF